MLALHIKPFLATILGLSLTASAAPTPSSPGSSVGCGKNPPLDPGSSTSYTLATPDGRTRRYTIHLPSSYKPATPAPLILSFHGNTKTAANQEQLSGFDNEEWNPDGIAIYPQGVNNAWQGAPYADASISDKAFITALLDHLEARYCIDPRRIYASGKSLGGGFTNVLACSPSLSQRFAAFAPVSGAFYTGNADDDCHPKHTVTPVMEFHGLADKTIPYAGGEHKGVDLPSVLDWTARWAARGGCHAQPVVETLFDGNVKHYSWTCPAANGTLAVQHYAIAGLGHAWPSVAANSDNSKGTYLDATPLIMDFFNQHVNELAA
ncbi:putative ferulic acid esterase [Fimicolochytrium jonesii]|uniref:putative ferulic acid esterase n=1 Tax=Fimicolochytrium jonesii TaxID=1396493 RepID=UPI0022FEBF23|nr:putative ferulic acid esterase [Fimicolochytrium jonesii]KAI8818295.1 putative ferulic acid esterase [Fimicolochytrium jonesii]